MHLIDAQVATGQQTYSYNDVANSATDTRSGTTKIRRQKVDIAYAVDPPPPDCRCGIPAAVRSVMKDSRNKGRKFFCCSKPQNDANNCKFFQFCDEDANGFRARTSLSATNETVCSRCMKTGHFARSCTEA